MGSCRSCGKPVVWAVTDHGRSMPVDKEPATGGNLVLFREGDIRRVRAVRLPGDQMRPRHISHFATCPKADQHRKEGK